MSTFNPLIAIPFVLLAVIAGLLWRRWLAAAWIFTVLVFPLIRFQIGAPIYLMDVVSVLLLWQMLAGAGQVLVFSISRWPAIFIALALVSTAASGLLLFGF